MSDNHEITSRHVDVLGIEYAGAEDLVRDYTEQMSADLVFLDTKRSFVTGARVCLQLTCPGLLQPVRLLGVVRWPRGHEGESGVGIELDPPEARQVQDAMIERIARRDPTLVARLLRILVVEDNRHVASLIRTGLQGVGRRSFGDATAFDFRMASNGREALGLLAEEHFDTMIIDMYLPVLDGTQVITHVRNDPALRELPIVAVSAGGESARAAAMRAGADHFVAKPMRLKQITDLMHQLFVLDSR